MATQIDSIIRLRRGPDSERQSTVLSSGEISYSTDIGRIFIGDGQNVGGNVAGNKVFYGTTPSISAVKYDLFYNTSNSGFYMLTGGGGDNLSNYIRLTNGVGSGVKIDGSGNIILDTGYLSNSATGYVKLSGDSMTGTLSTKGLTADNFSTFKDVVNHTGNRIINVGNPTAVLDAVNKQYTDNSLYTLSGDLVALIYALSSSLNAANVALSANFVKKSGDTMTGKLTIQNTLSVTGNITTNSDVIGFY